MRRATRQGLTSPTPGQLGGFIDHTCLRPEATSEDITRLCGEAISHGFYAVCVNSGRVLLAKSALRGCLPRLVATVGFPFGASSTEGKLAEAGQAIDEGADEIDVVINIGKLVEGDVEFIGRELGAIVDRAHGSGKIVKVIIETGFLTPSLTTIASRLVQGAGADFVKTCTGYGPRGVSIEDVNTIRNAVGPNTGIKASGGIRSYEQAVELIAAGATRLGCSRSVAITKSL